MFNIFKKKQQKDEPPKVENDTKNKDEDSGLKDMQVIKIERFLKENPIPNDYKLTTFDLVMINTYLLHCARIYHIDSHVGYTTGNLHHLLMKLQVVFSRKTIDIEDQ